MGACDIGRAQALQNADPALLEKVAKFFNEHNQKVRSSLA